MTVILYLFSAQLDSSAITWDMAQQIIQTQSDITTTLITAIGVLAFLVAAASWFTNFQLVSHRIKLLESEVKTRLDNALSENRKTYQGLVQKIEKDTKFKLTLLDAEKAKIFAIFALEHDNWDLLARWSAIALPKYTEVKLEDQVRICVDNLVWGLANAKKISKRTKDAIEKCLPYIPDIIEEKRKEIQGKVKNLLVEETE